MSENPENAGRDDHHPDLAELDAFRTGEADAEAGRHVESCETCRAAARDIETLAAKLKAAARAPGFGVPAEIDARILLAARAFAATKPPLRRRRRDRASAIARRGRARNVLRLSWPGWVAAAAVLMAVGLFSMSTKRVAPGEFGGHETGIAQGERPTDASRAGSPRGDAGPVSCPPNSALDRSMDIDHSGGVDIVDAYILSRRLRRREAVPGSCDFDGDGRVGDSDVKAVAARAVALAGGGI